MHEKIKEMTFEQLRSFINSKPKEEEFIIDLDFSSLKSNECLKVHEKEHSNNAQ